MRNVLRGAETDIPAELIHKVALTEVYGIRKLSDRNRLFEVLLYIGQRRTYDITCFIFGSYLSREKFKQPEKS